MLTATAPARADLAGGTLDIWPLCHQLGRPGVTVNLAINRRAQVTVEERNDGTVEIVSEDRDQVVTMPAHALSHEQLPLATRLIEWMGAGDGLTVRMRSTVPPGSGLGGSSALSIALAGALGRLRGMEWEIAALQNIETQVLGTPTGYQDYYPPLLGGCLRLEARPDRVAVERLDGAEEFLARHLVLIDSRIEHHSGMTNWEVFKRFIEGDKVARAALEGIADVAARMADAVAARDVDALAASLRDEWSLRRQLSPVVSNAEIEALIAAAEAEGALAAKVTGAGGGGCVVFVVEDAATSTIPGARIDFAPDPDGLVVS
ncbi:MAG: GHMP family kinase ATP-binding protein [Planctomycetota bacterium]|jgi:D-glycero-alpha-D-manno-heptose-7-phosphate kinase